MDSRKKSDFAILDLESPVEGQQQQQQPDGHQILNQVQRELQFLPTTNEDMYVSGTLGSTSSHTPMEPQVIVTGSGEREARMGKDTDDLLVDSDPIDLGPPPGTTPKHTIWQWDYYARYFDTLTVDIFWRRVLWSLLPLTGENRGTYIERHIQSNPDLYGPFWIPLTLSIILSFCCDINIYQRQWEHLSTSTATPTGFNSNSSSTTPSPSKPSYPTHPLEFGFTGLNVSTTVTFTYLILAPLVLWSFCQWRRCTRLYTLLECLCAYGYSLSVFIPLALLGTVANHRQVQFILFASGAFLSGSVLLISFAPVVHSDPSHNFKSAYLMLLFVLIAHLFLSLFYLYYFL